jgi:hypothetical protein
MESVRLAEIRPLERDAFVRVIGPAFEPAVDWCRYHNRSHVVN